jgi:phosphatidylinositol dimannoside acyltransferase
VADSLAAGIAEHPEDWHMLQRMWSSPSPGGSVGEPASPRGSASLGQA